MTCILGIDPGLSGAIAFYFTDHPTRVSVRDMPVVDHQVSGALILQLLDQLRPDMAFIERVSAMPGQGVTSMFNFGCAYGVVRGVIEGQRIPHRFVTPGVWKRHFGLDSDKDRSRGLALRTFTDTPEHFARKKDDGRAEAALIALYGAQVSLGLAQAGGATGDALRGVPSFETDAAGLPA